MCAQQWLRLDASLRFGRLQTPRQFDATQLNLFWSGCSEVRTVIRSGELQLHGARLFGADASHSGNYRLLLELGKMDSYVKLAKSYVSSSDAP